MHDDKGGQDAHRQADNDHQGGAQVKQEHRTDQNHDQELFQQLAVQVVDGVIDERGAVIGGHHFDAVRQARANFLQALLDAVNGFKGVFTEAHHHDATGDFPFPVQFGDSTSHLGAKPNIRHISQQQRFAITIDAQRDLP